MIISKTVYSGEGNSVANYTEFNFRCDKCHGRGWIMEEYKEEECLKCNGEGEYTVRT